MATVLDPPRRLVGQHWQVGGQGGEIIQGYRDKGRGAALIELVQAEPTRSGMALQGLQDGVAVVVRRPQCWLRHGASVLDN